MMRSLVYCIKWIDSAIGWISRQLSCLLLLLLVLVVLYSVVLRYVFNAPPFWTDRISVFANMTMVFVALGITVRNRELVAMQGLYEQISKPFAQVLEMIWVFVILIFGLVFTWYGAETAMNMPGQYWDFQDFCIDLGLGDVQSQSVLRQLVDFIESGVGAAIRPLCVDGAVPQKYLAMLMPISGVLVSLASLAVLFEDLKNFKNTRSQ